MTQELAVYCFGHNLEAIRYPYLASIESALALTRLINGTGAVWFAVCDCTDQTEQIVRDHFKHQISDGELMIVYHPWRDHHHIQVEVCNFLLDIISGRNFDYGLKLDTDEVLHEDSFAFFKDDLRAMAKYGYGLGKPHYTHLLDNQREFDFIYRTKAVISDLSVALRYTDNDACALGGSREASTLLEVIHYGKYQIGREREALLKEITFTRGYQDLGFPDPRVVAQLQQGYIDYDKVFENAKEHGQIRPWRGTHPAFAKPWVEQALVRSEQFKADLAAGQIKPLETEKWWA